jgi:hypothetical protein
MEQIRNEIYDDKGLVRVEYTEVEDEKTAEELLKEKEEELLKIYNEIQQIKNQQ